MEKTERKTTDRKITDRKTADRDSRIDWIVFAILFAGMIAVTFGLFYRQCIENVRNPESIYHADMRAYILEIQGLNTTYSFPYPIFFKFAAFLHLFMAPDLAVAIATTVMNGLSVVIVKKMFNKMLLPTFRESFSKHIWFAGVWISMVSFGLFFVSMLFPPPGMYLPGIKYTYLGVFTPNPFHNATYMAARPFAILAFVWFAKLLDEYEREFHLQDHILFSLFLLAATMTKPSFTLVLVGAAGLIMLWRLFRQRFRNMKQTVMLGLTFLPTFADLLYQFNGVFVPEEGVEGGIGFCFGEIWGVYCDNLPLAIVLAIGFPILVLLCHIKDLKTNACYRFSWQIYLMGFAMTFFLYEKGFRALDFNFSWGYMYGIFFVFFTSMMILIRSTARRERPVLLAAQWLMFFWHLTCGMYYFYGIIRGRMYY